MNKESEKKLIRERRLKDVSFIITKIIIMLIVGFIMIKWFWPAVILFVRSIWYS